ncbi:MAG TPA: hypothetical protein VF047_05720 [Nitrososphaeraceae archaeon]
MDLKSQKSVWTFLATSQTQWSTINSMRWIWKFYKVYACIQKSESYKNFVIIFATVKGRKFDGILRKQRIQKKS